MCIIHGRSYRNARYISYRTGGGKMGSHQQDKIVKVQKPYERMGERGKKQSDVSAYSRAGRKNRNMLRAVSPSPVPASLLPHCLPSHYQLCKQYAGIWSCLNLCELSQILGSRKYVLIPPLFEAAKFLGLHE